jgi:hypothetical protein
VAAAAGGRLSPASSCPDACRQRWRALQADPPLAQLPDDVLAAVADAVANYR